MLQLVAKMGGEPWAVDIPLKNIPTIVLSNLEVLILRLLALMYPTARRQEGLLLVLQLPTMETLTSTTVM